MRNPRVVLLLAVSLLASSIAFAEEAETHFLREAVGVKSYAAAPRIVARMQVEPAATLSAAAGAIPDQLEALRSWNAEGRQPARNGLIRSLGETMAVRFGGVAVKSGLNGRGVVVATSRGTTWGTSLRVENAQRLRLHLENVELPAGTTLWVYGRSGEAVPFDTSLMDEKKGLWTPSVNGDTLYLEIEVPAGTSGSFDAKEVLELLYGRGANFRSKSDDAPTCLPGQDATCQTAAEFPGLAAARAAVGQMEFVVGNGGAVCSGTLINDQRSSGTPLFLTANHCIAEQTAASSLQTYFDFAFESCVSSNSGYLPAVSGATLLTTSGTTDVTLLRLPSLPSNRAFLGWTNTPPTNGTALHRISHPVPDGSPEALPQMYSRTIVKSTGTTCPSLQRPNFIYSNETNGGEGGVYGGSSGSSALLADAKIVGQLQGSCGPDPAAGCDRRNDTVDGAFSQSFSVLSSFLTSSGTTPQPCVANSSTICLVNNRFSVRVTYDVGNGHQPMTAIKYTPDTGLFWFDQATNIEILLKMINACSFNQRFWVFVGGTTDVGVGITVTDTTNGTVKTYSNPRGSKFQTITASGNDAFATCP